MKVVQLLGLRRPWRHQVCRDTDCLHRRSYGSIRASCSWRSEGLFGHCFSITLPIQTLRGLPSLRSFSVVWCIRHTEGAPLTGVLLCKSVHQALKGAPWVGSCSVVQCIRRLTGQPLYCSAADASCGEREALVMATPSTCDSAVSPCFHGCLAFLHRHFPPQSSPSQPLDLSLESIAALAWGLLHNP